MYICMYIDIDIDIDLSSGARLLRRLRERLPGPSAGIVRYCCCYYYICYYCCF